MGAKTPQICKSISVVCSTDSTKQQQWETEISEQTSQFGSGSLKPICCELSGFPNCEISEFSHERKKN